MKIKRNYRVILLAVLVLGWMGVIFAFSSQNGTKSSETSGRVVNTVIAVIKPNFDQLTKSEQIRFRDRVTFFVRKGAHFTEYAILGALLFLFFYEWRPKLFWTQKKEQRLDQSSASVLQLRMYRIWLAAWIVGTFYAATDEFHQMFSGGRSPQVRDVCIDSSGVAVGCLFVLAVTVLLAKLGSGTDKLKGRKNGCNSQN